MYFALSSASPTKCYGKIKYNTSCIQRRTDDFSIIVVAVAAEKTWVAENLWAIVSGKFAVSIIGLNAISTPPPGFWSRVKYAGLPLDHPPTNVPNAIKLRAEGPSRVEFVPLLSLCYCHMLAYFVLF